MDSVRNKKAAQWICQRTLIGANSAVWPPLGIKMKYLQVQRLVQ